MSRNGRISMILVLGVLAMTTLLMTSALATEEGGDEGGEQGANTTVVDSGLTPAVPMEDNAAAAAEPDWTYRYMIPTAIVIAGVIVMFTAIKYFTDVVRKRYRIVEE